MESPDVTSRAAGATCLAVQWLGLRTPNAGATGSILGGMAWTKIKLKDEKKPTVGLLDKTSFLKILQMCLLNQLKRYVGASLNSLQNILDHCESTPTF